MTFPITSEEERVNSDLSAAINRQWGNDVAGARQVNRTGMLQYWRKCQRKGCPRHTDKFERVNLEEGWIVVGPDMGSPIEHARYINNKHMTPLPQYGSMPHGELGAANPVMRFRQLLERGGLHELPQAQIYAYNWDKIPEVMKYRTDLVPIKRINCSLGCTNRDFITNEEYQSHISGWHAEAKGTIAIGQELGKVMAAQKQQAAPLTDPLAIGAAVSAAIAQMMPQLMAELRNPTALQAKE